MNQPTKNSFNTSIQSDTSLRIAIVSSCWHKPIVENAIKSIRNYFETQGIDQSHVACFEVPGSFELPLHVSRLAQTGKYDAIIACGLVVNGGIYRHEFVASAVIEGLMQVQLNTGIPVFSAVLTPLNFHEHEEHINFFAKHFVLKGKEVAQTCIETVASLRNLG